MGGCNLPSSRGIGTPIYSPERIVQSDQRHSRTSAMECIFTSCNLGGRTSLSWKKVGLVCRGLTDSNLAAFPLTRHCSKSERHAPWPNMRYFHRQCPQASVIDTPCSLMQPEFHAPPCTRMLYSYWSTLEYI